MVARTHRSTTDSWANTHVSLATSFAQFDIAMVKITNLTNCCVTNLMNEADLAGGHANLGEVAFFGEQLCRAACRTNSDPLPF
jgi:hypothetical protein